MNSAKHQIVVAGKTVTGQYGSPTVIVNPLVYRNY